MKSALNMKEVQLLPDKTIPLLNMRPAPLLPSSAASFWSRTIQPKNTMNCCATQST
jgi:hypothetical protein